jgi:hypothetical protein
VHLPLEERDWKIGLIVGPSGSGKTTVAREVFGQAFTDELRWPDELSIIDAFPAALPIKEVTGLLASVGFNSPPSWLRPYRALSIGEQFRATMARGLAENPDLLVVDEFTSTVDRTVARIASSAIERMVRRGNGRLVAVGCHDDVTEWLRPDWIYQPATDDFTWRSLQRRPAIELEIRRVSAATWRIFKRHHYLSGNLHPAAMCFVGSVEGRPACFTAVLPFPHPMRPGWREHRTVCLPDFQGVGIGNRQSEFVASLFAATGRPFRSVTSNPAMIWHRARSVLWKMTRPPARMQRPRLVNFRNAAATRRLTASFEYIGPSRLREAWHFGIAGVTACDPRTSPALDEEARLA